jgi:Flp pilus assembly pilin Flp
MTKLATAARRFVRDEQAATTVEYGIIVVVMAAIAVAALTSLDGSIGALFGGAKTNITKGTGFTSKIPAN